MQAELEIPIATTYGNMTLAQMTQYADFLPKPLYFSSTPWMENTNQDLGPGGGGGAQALPRRIQGGGSVARRILDPELGSRRCCVIEALRKIGPGATGAQLRDYLRQPERLRRRQRHLRFRAHAATRPRRDGVGGHEWNPAKNTWDVVSKPTGIPLEQLSQTAES